MAKKTLVITGGGSGGHVYPGIAIAKSIQATHPDWDIVFVGAEGGLEQKIVPENNFPLHLLKIGRIRSSVGFVRQLLTLLSIPLAIFSAFILFFKLKPKAVLGVGGFASFPFLLVSLFMRIKTYTWEGNAYPGLVNRKLGRWADKNFLVFEDAKKIQPVNTEVIGIPIRADFFQLKKIKSPTPPFKVLVFGGSQGSQAINLVVQKNVNSISIPAERF